MEIIEISQAVDDDIFCYTKTGKHRRLSKEQAARLIEVAKSRFSWYFCPFDDVIMDYRFIR